MLALRAPGFAVQRVLPVLLLVVFLVVLLPTAMMILVLLLLLLVLVRPLIRVVLLPVLALMLVPVVHTLPALGREMTVGRNWLGVWIVRACSIHARFSGVRVTIHERHNETDVFSGNRPLRRIMLLLRSFYGSWRLRRE